MSFPASGFEQWYRNNINKVSEFLEERHQGHYKIYNLSNRTYNYSKFKGEVKSYEWEDHHSPPMLTLFKFWCDVYNYLLDPNNVVVVHCNAGKGRTGTSIACFLLYSGLSTTAEDAIRYYGRKRFSTGLGITQPSQIRYVKYFEMVYRGAIVSPTIRILKAVNMHTIPHFNGKSWKPYLEIVTIWNFETVYWGKYWDYLKSYKWNCNKKKFPKKDQKLESKEGLGKSASAVHLGLGSMEKTPPPEEKSNVSFKQNAFEYRENTTEVEGSEFVRISADLDEETKQLDEPEFVKHSRSGAAPSLEHEGQTHLQVASVKTRRHRR